MQMFGFTQEQAERILEAARHGLDGLITANEVANKIEQATNFEAGTQIERGEPA